MSADDWHEWYRGIAENLHRLDAGRIAASWRLRIVPDDGTPLAEQKSKPGLSEDRAGVYWRLHDGEVIRDGDRAREIADVHGYTDPVLRSWIARMDNAHGLKDGRQVQKRTSLPVLARALLIAGLVGEDVPLRRAVRLWMAWETELGRPVMDEDVNQIAGEVRRVWKRMGIQIPTGLASLR